jgi:hypothetical protein
MSQHVEINKGRYNQCILLVFASNSIQLFGDLDIPSFARAYGWNWIGYVNRMDSKRKVSHIFNSNPQENDPKTDG